MFFKKKEKAELSDQFNVFKERTEPRWGMPQYDLDAGVCITGFEGEGQLGNISVSGCSMKSVTYVTIIPDEVYQVKIIPGKDFKLQPFSLKLKVSWVKSSETLFLAGFSLENGQSSAELKALINVLVARGLIPDYGNMKR